MTRLESCVSSIFPKAFERMENGEKNAMNADACHALRKFMLHTL